MFGAPDTGKIKKAFQDYETAKSQLQKDDGIEVHGLVVLIDKFIESLKEAF